MPVLARFRCRAFVFINLQHDQRYFVMRDPFKPFISRAVALLGLLGLGFMQVGCAHSVVLEPSVTVHSRTGHFPVYGQVGVPGAVVYAPPPRVIYVPAPPPRVVYAPSVWGPVHAWGHRHGRHGGHRDGRWDERRDDRYEGRPGHGERYEGRR